MFLIGVLLLCSAVLLFVITLLGSRNPNHPSWASESIVGNVLAPMIVALSFTGAICSIQAVLEQFPPSLQDLTYGLATVAATVVICKMLRISKRLQAFEEQAKSGQVLKGTFPEPPAKPGSYRKAA